MSHEEIQVNEGQEKGYICPLFQQSAPSCEPKPPGEEGPLLSQFAVLQAPVTRRLPSPPGSAPEPALPAVLSFFLGKGSHSCIGCHSNPCRERSVCLSPALPSRTLPRHTGGTWLHQPPQGKRQRITPRITDYCKLCITEIKAKKRRTSKSSHLRLSAEPGAVPQLEPSQDQRCSRAFPG